MKRAWSFPKHFPVANLKDLIGTGISPQKRIVDPKKSLLQASDFLVDWWCNFFLQFSRGVETTNRYSNLFLIFLELEYVYIYN